MKPVIIIDDDRLIAAFVDVAIQKLGFNSVTFIRVEDALKFVEKSSVDIMITDIFMPGIGGIQGIQMFRAKFPKIKIIAMSAGWHTMSPEDTIKAATEIGADIGLQKPFTLDQLMEVVKSLGI